jgi:hypothetical protein
VPQGRRYALTIGQAREVGRGMREQTRLSNYTDVVEENQGCSGASNLEVFLDCFLFSFPCFGFLVFISLFSVFFVLYFLFLFFLCSSCVPTL